MRKEQRLQTNETNETLLREKVFLVMFVIAKKNTFCFYTYFSEKVRSERGEKPIKYVVTIPTFFARSFHTKPLSWANDDGSRLVDL